MQRSISISDVLFLVNMTTLFQLWKSNKNRIDNVTTYVQDKSNSITTWSRVKLSPFRPNLSLFPFYTFLYIFLKSFSLQYELSIYLCFSSDDDLLGVETCSVCEWEQKQDGFNISLCDGHSQYFERWTHKGCSHNKLPFNSCVGNKSEEGRSLFSSHRLRSREYIWSVMQKLA